MLYSISHPALGQPAISSPGIAASVRAFSKKTLPPDVRVQVTNEQAHSFRQAISTLAQKVHVTFVIESEPIHATLAPGARLDMTPDGEPLSTLVPKIAAAYDYEATHSGNVFILTKRFSDPADVPDVTLAECSQAMDDVALVLAPFNPHFTRGQIEKSPAMQDLLSSLAPAQMEALQDKKHGLAVASLLPNQQQEAEQLVLFLYVQLPLGNTAPAMQQMKSVAESAPIFCRRDLGDVFLNGPQVGLEGVNLFGVELPNVQVSKMQFIPLSRPNNVTSFAGGIGVTWGDVIKGKAVLSSDDPTNPAAPSAPPPMTSISAFNSEALSEVIARLNVRTGGKPKIAVDTALAPKRVAVFGEQFTPPLKVLDSLAEVYGLRVRRSDDGKILRLTRRLFQVPLSPEGISLAIQSIMPAPMVRARQNYMGRQPTPLHVAAVRALRAVIEPKLKASKTGRVSLSELSSREDMTLAAALMADTAGELEEAFSKPFPPGVFNPDLLRLTGSVQEQDGHRTVDLHLALPSLDSKDTLVVGPGVGNMVIGP